MFTLSEIQRKTLALMEPRIEQIALLPTVVAKLAALDIESETATETIEALVRSDPPLALRLMRLANGGKIEGGTVTTISDAIRQVGSRRLAEMVFALSVVEVFVPHTAAQRNLWIHSIQTALASRRLASVHTEHNVSEEESFLAGLLHDIGRFLIYEHRPRDMAEIDEAHVADPRDLIAAEIRVCGFDHATLGYLVCKRLNLPWSVCEMIRTHHFYREQKQQIAPEVLTLVSMVQEADCLSFGMLGHPDVHAAHDEALHDWITHSMRHIRQSEQILSPTRWVEEIRNIDHDARIAAEIVDLSYPGEIPLHATYKGKPGPNTH